MTEIVRPFTTVSDKIRALDAAGAPRAEIARFLGKRYQHVRNVLVEGPPKERFTVGRVEFGEMREQAAPAYVVDTDAATVRLPVGQDGSLQLPQSVLAALGWKPGGVAIAELQGDRLTVLSVAESIRRVRQMIRELIPGDHSLVDSLIADRRREAAAEEND
ncbi:MAG TPA: AbrB/MazE/SpoVT family DNA-binding domain-containing protein [Caulobacteraceae bacterium]|nr:AbrB/MazE/SpoVT family DNA-binding domain-containing protein [Caulobacteraceae bacterium]